MGVGTPGDGVQLTVTVEPLAEPDTPDGAASVPTAAVPVPVPDELKYANATTPVRSATRGNVAPTAKTRRMRPPRPAEARSGRSTAPSTRSLPNDGAEERSLATIRAWQRVEQPP